MTPTIYKYIEQEESAYKTEENQLGDNWSWNMRDHIQMIFHLKNSVFYTGKNDWMRPFKNILEPLIELANWTEDIELKDVVFFIDGEEDRVKSFLIKKYHDEVFSRKYNLEEFIDKITEMDNEYGGVIVKDTKKGAPETPSLINIAFCDQTDILGGPIGFKYFFSPDSLRRMSERGWGKEANGATISLDDLTVLAESQKEVNDEQQATKTPGKLIEVYIVQGPLPEHYLLDNGNMEDWYNQVHVVAFYRDKKNARVGVTLYKKKEKDSLMFHTAQPVENRALGRSVAERLLHSQVWTNWLAIHKHKFYEAASKVPLVTDDPAYANRNEVQDMENLEVTTIAKGSMLQAVQTASPANVQMMMNGIDEWFQHAQLTGAAQDPILGKEAVSGTTFRGQERTVAQGRGAHDRKRGKRAKFIEEVYRKMLIPQMQAEILKGTKFLAKLSTDEIGWIREQVAINAVNKRIKEAMLTKGAQLPSKDEREEIKNTVRQEFGKKGQQRLVEILKGEFDDVTINLGINVANKQKDLSVLSDKILAIFQYVFQNPQGFQQAMQIPALSKSFHDILEFSGLNQADFMSLIDPPQQTAQQTPQQSSQQPSPLQLAPQNEQAG